MSIRNNIGELLLKPIISVLIGQDKLQFYETIDWQKQSERFRQTNLIYPDYYSQPDFHGIEGGYLNPIAAITYDTVTAYASPPNETRIREQLITTIENQPSRILDLGCGTGSTTLMLKQAFQEAVVIGLDLSPYMLIVADYKAEQAGLDIQWQHGLAESAGFDDASLDLVTVSMVLHETPPLISQLIVQECCRLLEPGGQLIILDGNQRKLRYAHWLIELFREPYSKDYADHRVEDWMIASFFKQVQTEYVGWIHQVTSGIKPVSPRFDLNNFELVKREELIKRYSQHKSLIE
ncbi:methyltransferase domain-containing protein [Coleofasciculus chthonoplastes]|uniref:methyltransferase domain-containing protein n=1 Tax=Coleofasciculus chthonoplastes TaxID=64178 RepID=UPI0032F4F024